MSAVFEKFLKKPNQIQMNLKKTQQRKKKTKTKPNNRPNQGFHRNIPFLGIGNSPQ